MASNKLTIKVTPKPWLKYVSIPFLLVGLQVPTWLFKRGVTVEVDKGGNGGS